MRDKLRSTYHPVYYLGARRRPSARAMHNVVTRLRPGMRFWARPPNPARRLCALVRRILKFHESEPMLSRQPMITHR
jgi:hypothetical protein